MHIRELTPTNHVEYSGISKTVFFDTNRANIREKMKNPLEHVDQNDDYVRIGCFENESTSSRLLSALTILPYTIRMNGKHVKMGGIGNVVTRPEARSRGCISKIFTDRAFSAMVDDGQVFSFLYPFSYAYYRKLGYELCYHYNKLSVPLEQFAPFGYPAHIEAFQPGDDISPFMHVYDDFARDRNLSVVRSEKDWQRLLDRDPYQNLEFTYLCRNSLGEGIAYILYGVGANADKDSGSIMEIKECCWASPDGLRDMLGFIGRLSAEFESAAWNVPDGVNAHMLFPNGYDIDWKADAGGMNRIVNVTAALSTLNAPLGSGRVTIAVSDDFWTQNSGTYTVEWDGGGLSAKKQCVSQPNMELTIQTLTQLVTGYLSPEEISYKKCTYVHGNHAEINALFPKKKLYLLEAF